jgi:hypothetical protein
VIFFVGCRTNKNLPSRQHAGAIVIRTLVKRINESDSAFRPMKYNHDQQLLFKDSFFIEDRIAVETVTDMNGNESWKAYIQKYIFVDLPSRSLYDYNSFSDTAILLRAYTQADSAFKEGYDYFGFKKSVFGEQTQILPDTLIDHITYKRLRSDTVYKKQNGDKRIESYIAYLRCDKSNSIMVAEKAQSKKIGCPVVRVDIIDYQSSYVISTRWDMVADTLTPQELKVFAAWEKYAKEHPVTK